MEKKHNVPEFLIRQKALDRLFKTVDDNPLADLGTQLDNIEKEGKSLG